MAIHFAQSSITNLRMNARTVCNHFQWLFLNKFASRRFARVFVLYFVCYRYELRLCIGIRFRMLCAKCELWMQQRDIEHRANQRENKWNKHYKTYHYTKWQNFSFFSFSSAFMANIINDLLDICTQYFTFFD